ncbi:hypothetical protein [Demequina sp. NBRC 110056]|uniref:hypothetical protein n=1 Tax=Demequina sp. NBRC 110056 TaxID=1570345 RepID=UPI000A01CD8E|nr:hypothetical protein [Demequina sp. NBRC 110056]
MNRLIFVTVAGAALVLAGCADGSLDSSEQASLESRQRPVLPAIGQDLDAALSEADRDAARQLPALPAPAATATIADLDTRHHPILPGR